VSTAVSSSSLDIIDSAESPREAGLAAHAAEAERRAGARKDGAKEYPVAREVQATSDVTKRAQEGRIMMGKSAASTLCAKLFSKLTTRKSTFLSQYVHLVLPRGSPFRRGARNPARAQAAAHHGVP
jgi:hypothetical protein